MPFSKEHNILFIHIPKNAGKSFEVALDIASQEEVNGYKWRTIFNRLGKLILNKTKDKNSLSRLWGVHDMSLALQHLTFAEIELLNLLDEKVLKNAIKVAIVRNPFDRVVSSYHHMKNENESFLDFIKTYYHAPNRDHNALAHKRLQIDFLRDKKGNIIVDNILRFEKLEYDFEDFKNKYNLQTNSLPHIGKQRSDSNYKKYFCDESFDLVVNLFGEDIDLLEYKY